MTALSIAEIAGGALGYGGIGTVYAHRQSVRCWKAAVRRYRQSANQRQGWRELLAIRFFLWPLYLPAGLIEKFCEAPVAAMQAELADTKSKLDEWTEHEKFAIDNTGEAIAKLEVARLKKRVLELEQ
jgi:hypothetical protein